jgi:predicted RNA-binding protein YlxR (DUF448 family)
MLTVGTEAQARKLLALKKDGASFRELDAKVFGLDPAETRGGRSFYVWKNIQNFITDADLKIIKKVIGEPAKAKVKADTKKPVAKKAVVKKAAEPVAAA